jgi:hypothetical protein
VSHDLLVAGTSLKTYATIASFDGVFSGAPTRGQDLPVPLRRGAVGTAKVRDSYTFSVPMTILGTSEGNFHDNLDALRALCDTSYGVKTITRTKPSGAGDLTTTCSATCQLIDASMFDSSNGRVVLDVTNLDGCWYGSAATPTIPATITVAGTTRTHRMTLVLPGAGTLTNTTLGVSVTVTASATLTVETQSTTGTLADVVAAGDPFGNWFALAPGSNVITWSGAGTPTISYNPAYL